MLRATAGTSLDEDHTFGGLVSPVDTSSDRRPVEVLEHAGITPDALVETEAGPVPASAIQPGDRVLGIDGSFCTVQWTGRYRRAYARNNGADRPVRISHASMFGGLGDRVTVLAPGQRVALSDPKHDLLFGAETVLCRARDLIHQTGVESVNRHAVNWVSILLDRAKPILVDGLWLESVSPDMHLLRLHMPDLAASICTAVPGLRFDTGQAAYLPMFPVLNSTEAALVSLFPQDRADQSFQSSGVSRSVSA